MCCLVSAATSPRSYHLSFLALSTGKRRYCLLPSPAERDDPLLAAGLELLVRLPALPAGRSASDCLIDVAAAAETALAAESVLLKSFFMMLAQLLAANKVFKRCHKQMLGASWNCQWAWLRGAAAATLSAGGPAALLAGPCQGRQAASRMLDRLIASTSFYRISMISCVSAARLDITPARCHAGGDLRAQTVAEGPYGPMRVRY